MLCGVESKFLFFWDIVFGVRRIYFIGCFCGFELIVLVLSKGIIKLFLCIFYVFNFNGGVIGVFEFNYFMNVNV